MKPSAIVAGIALWLICILGAFGFVWRYKTTPGPEAATPQTWPAASKLDRDAAKPNLIVFAHPHCPCTRATIAELARLATVLGTLAQIHVVLVRPPDSDPGFEDGTIAERARAIPGARVIVDDSSVEAHRFGAKTSGKTLLYTAAGQLAFSGGLTTARGHEGEAPAHDRILAAVRGAARTQLAITPTFGCEIDDPERAR